MSRHILLYSPRAMPRGIGEGYICDTAFEKETEQIICASHNTIQPRARDYAVKSLGLY
jgi:hypothetical protein